MNNNIKAIVMVVFGIVIFVVGYFLKAEIAPMVVGGLLTFAGVVWFIYNKVQAKKATAVDETPEVKTEVVEDKKVDETTTK